MRQFAKQLKQLPKNATFDAVAVCRVTDQIIGIMYKSSRRRYLVRTDGKIVSRSLNY